MSHVKWLHTSANIICIMWRKNCMDCYEVSNLVLGWLSLRLLTKSNSGKVSRGKSLSIANWKTEQNSLNHTFCYKNKYLVKCSYENYKTSLCQCSKYYKRLKPHRGKIWCLWKIKLTRSSAWRLRDKKQFGSHVSRQCLQDWLKHIIGYRILTRK
jgi:hypothetical protein